MKPCAYCGKENDLTSAVCAECGTEFATQLEPQPQSDAGQKAGIRPREILTEPVQMFRALVLLSIIAYLVWFFQLLLGARMISDGTWDALAWQGYGALLPMPPRLGWLILILFLAVSVGLWTFSRSARLVFVMLTVFWIATCPLGGLQVQTAFGSFLLLLLNLANGGMLVLAYTAPLKEKFE